MGGSGDKFAHCNDDTAYANALTTANLEELAALCRQHIHWLGPAQNYVAMEGFKSALPHFVEACRTIVEGNEHPRLKRLIVDLFTSAKMLEKIKPQAPNLPLAPAE